MVGLDRLREVWGLADRVLTTEGARSDGCDNELTHVGDGRQYWRQSSLGNLFLELLVYTVLEVGYEGTRKLCWPNPDDACG